MTFNRKIDVGANPTIWHQIPRSWVKLRLCCHCLCEPYNSEGDSTVYAGAGVRHPLDAYRRDDPYIVRL